MIKNKYNLYVSTIDFKIIIDQFRVRLNNNKEKDAMFRVILSFVLTVFLFASLIGTANFMFKSKNVNTTNVIAQVSEKKDTRLSIKEIESVTASSNFQFTSINALR